MVFDAVYYEPDSLKYELGLQLMEQYPDIPWIPIESHNSIKEMQEKPNSEFGHMKRNLIMESGKPINMWRIIRYPTIWYPLHLPAAPLCACIVIWSATIINVRISGFL